MYESFYKLTKQPFQLSPDPRFFYGSPGHKRAMAYLRYGLAQGEGFIVITGDIGTGKTMLVNTLFDDLPKNNVVAAQLVTTQLKEDDTLRMVAASFGLAHEGLEKATILKNLEAFMTSHMQQGKRVLLLVDEVQNLPVRSLEELRMLSNFQLGGRVLFQSFLLGQAEFRKTIQSKGLEQLRQRVIAAYHLEPLDEEQTRGYIEHRLGAAGWRNDPKFSDAAYSAIYKYSGGTPRRINSLCDRLLLFGVLENIHVFDSDKIDIVYQELRRETSFPDTVRNDEKTEGKDRDNRSVIPLGKRQQSSARGAVANEAQAIALEGDVEACIAQLGQRVIKLEADLQRLRHAFLLSGDVGELE